MKPAPLKNKLKENMSIVNDVRDLFWKEDVSAAVAWLKEELTEGAFNPYEMAGVLVKIDEAFEDVK